MAKRYNEDFLAQESTHQLCNLLHSAAYIPLRTNLFIRNGGTAMYQQPAPQPRDEREWQSSSYSDSGGSPQYGEGYRASTQYNDQLADAVAQRLRVEFRSGLQPSRGASSGQRLALAIVSLALLVPLLSIILSLSSFTAFFAIVAVGLVCLAIIIVNIVFNMVS